MEKLKQSYIDFRTYYQQHKINGNDPIQFYNWWGGGFRQQWLYQFVVSRGLLPKGKRLNFFSVFGNPDIMRFAKGRNVFFSGENLHQGCHAIFSDYSRVNQYADLVLGFDETAPGNYMRFPLWITYMFPANSTAADIKKRCEQLCFPKIGERNQFAALVARYDWNNTRSRIYESLLQIGDIKCPSTVLHNDDSLKEKYRDNKVAYLKQFCFNICPENSNADGYVTEKCFEAIASGCIPIYWGSNNNPEPNILNRDAMILWNLKETNDLSITLVTDLWNNNSRLQEFATQPRLCPDAYMKVEQFFESLEKDIVALLV